MTDMTDIIPVDCPIYIIDLGAAFIPGQKIHYHKLLDIVPCHIIGFDANDKAAWLDTEKETFTLINTAVGDGKKHTFYKTQLDTCSSCIEPNIPLCSKFHGISEYLEVTDTCSVQTEKLDDLIHDVDVDFIKLDVQGFELTVLQHAKRILKKCLVLELEVEFIEQYKNQPLFSDLDRYLRTQNFQFHTFLGYGTRALKPLRKKHKLAGFNQWLWSDAVFIKALMTMDSLQMSIEKLYKAAVILHTLYESYDFAHYLLNLASADVASRYEEFVNEEVLQLNTNV